MAEQDMHSQRLPLNEGMNGTGGGLNGMGSLNGTGSLNGGASQSQGGTSPSGRLTAEQNNLDYAIGGGYQGSLQQILADNVGNRVIVDFLVGSSNIVRKEGILYLVGVSYIVLYESRNDTYVVCNLYAIEFVTFLPVGSSNSSGQQLARTTLKRV